MVLCAWWCLPCPLCFCAVICCLSQKSRCLWSTMRKSLPPPKSQPSTPKKTTNFCSQAILDGSTDSCLPSLPAKYCSSCHRYTSGKYIDCAVRVCGKILRARGRWLGDWFRGMLCSCYYYLVIGVRWRSCTSPDSTLCVSLGSECRKY